MFFNALSNRSRIDLEIARWVIRGHQQMMLGSRNAPLTGHNYCLLNNKFAVDIFRLSYLITHVALCGYIEPNFHFQTLVLIKQNSYFTQLVICSFCWHFSIIMIIVFVLVALFARHTFYRKTPWIFQSMVVNLRQSHRVAREVEENECF